jgi:hypothetical protein
MVAPERIHHRLHGALLIAACAGLLLAACASSKKPPAPAATLPPQTVAQVEPQPQAPSEPPVAAPVKDDSVIEIGPKEPEPAPPQDMVAAAKAERERRKHAGPPVAVITNETLKKNTTGKLTYADKPLDEEAREKRGDVAETAPSPDAATSSDPAVKEEYWRSKMLDVRLRWHDAVERIEQLQKKVAELRQKFYATDDPYQRDSVIKPAWDLALGQLDTARQESTAAREKLEQLLEEGRRAGALPGWLREGIEFEPKVTEPDDDLPTVEPGEPETLEGHEP